MWVTLAVQVLQALAAAATAIAPLVQQGAAVMSQTDAKAVHDALTQAEAATAALRPQVDAALQAAAQKP
jgi:hypothetical protein